MSLCRDLSTTKWDIFTKEYLFSLQVELDICPILALNQGHFWTILNQLKRTKCKNSNPILNYWLPDDIFQIYKHQFWGKITLVKHVRNVRLLFGLFKHRQFVFVDFLGEKPEWQSLQNLFFFSAQEKTVALYTSRLDRKLALNLGTNINGLEHPVLPKSFMKKSLHNCQLCLLQNQNCQNHLFETS